MSKFNIGDTVEIVRDFSGSGLYVGARGVIVLDELETFEGYKYRYTMDTYPHMRIAAGELKLIKRKEER